MKKPLLLILLFSIISLGAYSQEADHEELSYYQRSLQSGKNIRKVGTSMLVPGAVMLVSGIVMISSAQYDRDPNGNLLINDPNTSLGTLLVLNGLPLSVVGGILTLSGNSKMKRAQRQLDRISLSFYQHPTQQGVGITWRF